MPEKRSDPRLLRIYESKFRWHKARAKMKPEEKYEILVKLQILGNLLGPGLNNRHSPISFGKMEQA